MPLSAPASDTRDGIGWIMMHVTRRWRAAWVLAGVCFAVHLSATHAAWIQSHAVGDQDARKSATDANPIPAEAPGDGAPAEQSSESAESGGSILELAKEHFLNGDHLFEHVFDSSYIDFPKFLGGRRNLPNPLGRTKEHPLIALNGYPVLTGQFTRFMLLELVAAVLLLALFITAARKTRNGEAAKGRVANLLEVLVVFIRDDVARPTIGAKDASRFVPFLLTVFLFILTLNFVGLLPWFGSATGSISVTAVLAVLTFLLVIGTGIRKMGLLTFLKAQMPKVDMPRGMGVVMVPMIWSIEVFSLMMKHFVLAIRLFANMFSGHLVLAVFMAFVGVGMSIATVGLGSMIFGWGISLAAIVLAVFSNSLDLLIAAIQAYVFVFLASLFIGAALHAH